MRLYTTGFVCSAKVNKRSPTAETAPFVHCQPHSVVFTTHCCLQAPVMLALAEALTSVLVYVLLTRRTLPLQRGIRHFRYSFNHSLEDVLVLSLLRCVAVLMSLPLGPGSRCHRWVAKSALLNALCSAQPEAS